MESVRNRQLEWQRHVDDAKRVGVDMNIITRSADRLRLHRRAGVDLGSRAVGIIVKNPYDKFFE